MASHGLSAPPRRSLRPFAYLDHPREVIRQFTPNWFAVTMGTGILALALPAVPGLGPRLAGVGEALWFTNIALFGLFTLLYAARWAMFGHEARRIFGHSNVSMFIGTVPMGMATIVNGLLLFGLPRWGMGVVPVAHALWLIDVALAVGCGVLIPFLMFTRQDHGLEQMTPIWLLPVVTAEVAAVTAGLLAPHLDTEAARFGVLTAGYVLWALSVPLALGILTILFLRLVLHKLPPNTMAASAWLALGPIGTGALGLLVLGGQSPAIFAAHGLASAGSVAAGIGVIGGLVLWSLGLWWFALALLITRRYLRDELPFNLGWWGYTFPLGVFALATIKLAAVLRVETLASVGTALVTALALMWLLVMARTLRGAWRGDLFFSPCINATG